MEYGCDSILIIEEMRRSEAPGVLCRPFRASPVPPSQYERDLLMQIQLRQ